MARMQDPCACPAVVGASPARAGDSERQAPPPRLAPPPAPPPGEPAQMVQGGGPRGGIRGACAERRLLSRGRTPLSHLPDKHHENSAAHTVIAAPAAGRVSTSPFPRGESESEISPPPSSLRPPPAAAPAPPPPPPPIRRPAPTARRLVRPRLSSVKPPARRASAHPHPALAAHPPARRPRRRGARGPSRSGPPFRDQARKSSVRQRAGGVGSCYCCDVAAPGREATGGRATRRPPPRRTREAGGRGFGDSGCGRKCGRRRFVLGGRRALVRGGPGDPCPVLGISEPPVTLTPCV